MRSVAALVALVALLPYLAAAQAPPTVVRVATADERDLQQHQRVTGSLRAVSRGDVAALEAGRILEITVRAGATVQKGDVIARLDARRLEAQHAELVASLKASEAQVELRRLEMEQAQRDVERSQQLVADHVMTMEEHQHRQTTAAVAAAQLAVDQRRVSEVESQLRLFEVRLEDMVVKAPYDGRVVERHAEPGEWIQPGEPFVTLVSTGQVEAWVDVPERFSQLLDEGPLDVEIPGIAQPLRSVATKRVADVHPRTRTFPLVLTLDDQQGRLAAGMSVNVWIPVGELDRRITVPRDAVIRNGREAYVYKLVDEQGQTVAQQAPVVVAFETGEEVALAGGDLVSGDRVVVEGNERLMPGAAVMVAQPGQSGAATQVAAGR